jgi:hypothetical protein
MRTVGPWEAEAFSKEWATGGRDSRPALRAVVSGFGAAAAGVDTGTGVGAGTGSNLVVGAGGVLVPKFGGGSSGPRPRSGNLAGCTTRGGTEDGSRFPEDPELAPVVL